MDTPVAPRYRDAYSMAQFDVRTDLNNPGTHHSPVVNTSTKKSPALKMQRPSHARMAIFNFSLYPFECN